MTMAHKNRPPKLDLIDAVEIVMGKFGFQIQSKINNQFNWQVILLTLFAFVEMCQSVTLFIPTKNNELLLEIVCDAGYIGYGAKFRYILAPLYTTYRLNLFLMQMSFVFDKHGWLVKANEFFKKVPSVGIPRKLAQKTTKARFFVVLGAIFTVILVQVQIMTNFHRIYQSDSYVAAYGRFVLYFFSTGLQTFYSGAYFVQYYVLTNFCVESVDRYNAELKLLLKKKNFISSKQMVIKLEEFSNLYLMIQELKVFLKRAYMVFVLCMFGVSTQCYYTVFYTDIYYYNRIGQLFVMINFVFIIGFFSVLTDKINSKCREMGTGIFNTFIHSLDEKYSQKFQIEVCFALKRSF